MSARILIVDDNATNLRLISLLLRAEHHIVDQAEDADHALQFLQQVVPDLILMDIALPGMDGLTLTRLLRADVRLQSVAIIAFTAQAMKGDEQEAFQAGCDGYITKPIDTRLFPAQIAQWLERTSDRRRN